MTRIVVLLLGLFLVSSADLAAQDSRYTTSPLRIRADASTASAVRGVIPRGARVDVRACAVDWCWIEYRSRTGYVAERYLSAAPQYDKASGRSYLNAMGDRTPTPKSSDAGAPTGATAKCWDGTYSFSQTRRGTCSHHGGVARWL
jgi:uncharacterized protein YraI